jgi:peroxiredoxin
MDLGLRSGGRPLSRPTVRWHTPWMTIVCLAALGAAITADILRLTRESAPNLGLPILHGQATWAPGARHTPAFALSDQHGRVISPASQRGRTLLVAFLASTGRGGSAQEARWLAGATSSLARGERPVVDIVSTDPVHDAPAATAAAARSWGLADSGEYHWLSGDPRALRAVRRAFGVADANATRAIYLIDRDGFERTGYLFPFLPNFVALDLHTLAAQAR